MAYSLVYGSYTLTMPFSYSVSVQPMVSFGTVRGHQYTYTVSFTLTAASVSAFETARTLLQTNLTKTEQDLTIKHDATTVHSHLASKMWMVSEPSLSEPTGPDKSPISSRFIWTITFTTLSAAFSADGFILTYTDDLEEAPSTLKKWRRDGTLVTTDDVGSASTKFDALLTANNANLATPSGYVRTGKEKHVDAQDRNLEWSLVWEQRNVLPFGAFKDFTYSISSQTFVQAMIVTISGSVTGLAADKVEMNHRAWMQQLTTHFNSHPLIILVSAKMTDMRGDADDITNVLRFAFEYRAAHKVRPITRFDESVLYQLDHKIVDWDLLGTDPMTFTQQVAPPELTVTQVGMVESYRMLEDNDLRWVLKAPTFLEPEWERGVANLGINVPRYDGAATLYQTSWSKRYRVPAEEVEAMLIDGVPFAGVVHDKF